MKALFIVTVLLHCSFMVSSQNVILQIEEATFDTRNSSLKIKASITNNSKDTLRLLDAYSDLFNLTDLPIKKCGFLKRPYSIISKTIGICKTSPNAISLYEEPKRGLLLKHYFIEISPGEKKMLYAGNLSDKLCIPEKPIKAFPIALSYEVVTGGNCFSPEEQAVLDSLTSELISINTEVSTISPQVKIDSKSYLDEVLFHASYSKKIQRLYRQKLISKEILVTMN